MAVEKFELGGTNYYLPHCTKCDRELCWDMLEADYLLNKSLWDNWVCELCTGEEYAFYLNDIQVFA